MDACFDTFIGKHYLMHYVLNGVLKSFKNAKNHLCSFIPAVCVKTMGATLNCNLTSNITLKMIIILHRSVAFCSFFLISWLTNTDIVSSKHRGRQMERRQQEMSRQWEKEHWQQKEHPGHVIMRRTASGSQMVYNPNTKAK